MRILVVEDDKKVAAALKEGLEAARYEVTVTHSGEEGFFLVNEQTFDLVLLDLMLPGRGGLEVLRTLTGNGGRRAGACDCAVVRGSKRWPD